MSDPNVQLSDPVTLVLRQALGKLRVARVLSEQQADPVEQRALITGALDAVQDALDAREPTS
jgi:hypothetical protein